MAITLGVGPALTTGSSTSIATTLNSVTQGRAVLVGVGWANQNVTISSIAISGETNATLGTRQAVATGYSQWGIFPSISGSSGNKTVTVTFSGSVSSSGLWLQELVGVATSGTVDADLQFTSSTGTFDTNLAINGVTTASANAAVFMMFEGIQNPNNFTLDSPLTLLSTDNVPADFFGNIWNYWAASYVLDAGAAGSKAYTGDGAATNSSWSTNAISIKALGASGSVLIRQRGMMTGGMNQDFSGGMRN